jgi:hypothetical protein
MDIEDWLRSLGLERYEAAFRENEIDDTILPRLTAEDLKRSWASVLLDIAGSCSTPLLLYVLTRRRTLHRPLCRRLRRESLR